MTQRTPATLWARYVDRTAQIFVMMVDAIVQHYTHE